MVTSPNMIVTPVWRPVLSEIEAAFAHVTDRANRDIPRVFIAPAGMDVGWYSREFPEREVRFVDAVHLASVSAYSSWMAGPEVYELFSDAEFITLCQTDAVLVRSVAHVDTRGWDFLGAPWDPPIRVLHWGSRLSVHSSTGGGPLLARVLGRKLTVGNGGLSIRRVSAFLDVATGLQRNTPPHFAARVHEDVYFAALGPSAGLRVASSDQAGGVFCESRARGLTDAADYSGFHALEKWNPALAHRIAAGLN